MVGSILTTLAFILSVFSLVMYFLTFRGAKNTLQYARLAYHGMAMLVMMASTFLLYIILTHQYQYHYVYSYSNDDLSLGFLISTFWAGQEGSFMLWLLMTALIGIFLQSYTAKRGDLEHRVMLVFTISTSFLLAMVSPLLKNPFALLWAEPVFVELKNVSSKFLSLPAVQGFLFSDPNSNQEFVKVGPELVAALKTAGVGINEFIIHGKGLNPLLQNFWMQIHPPILFTGFALSTVPFAFALSALLQNDYRDWVRQSFPWILAQAGILGLGIMLGGYWAYGVLGWGGYWAWDPVENSSLVPWLVSVAAIHTMLVQKKYQSSGGIGKFARTNLILSILVYLLVLYSTFLTRSGILGDASVHSFVDPGMTVYLFLISFIGTFTLLGAGMIMYRWKHLNAEANTEEGLLSRELSLFTAAVALGASALIVLVGTSAPIFHQSVDTSFYNEMHVPLAIIIGILNGLSLLLKWKDSNGKEVFKKSRVALLASVAVTLLIAVAGGMKEVMMILLTFSAAFSLIVNGQIAWRIINGNRTMLGAYTTHIGLAVFMLGVVGSAAYSQQKDIDLVRGEKMEIFGYSLTFTEIHPVDDGKKYAFNVDVTKDGKTYEVKPVMYVSDFNQGLMREPDILVKFTKDFYISPLGYDDGTGQKATGNAVTLTEGEETAVEGARIKYVAFIKPDMSVMMGGGDFSMGAKLAISKDGKVFEKELLMQKTANGIEYAPVTVPELNMNLQLTKIDPANKNADMIVGKIDGGVPAAPKEILSVTASIKPFVSLVWFGVLIMFIGFGVSTFRRLQDSKA